MSDPPETAHTRRALLKTGGLIAGALIVPQMLSASVTPIVQQPAPRVEPSLPPAPVRTVAATPVTSPRVVRPELLKRALASLDEHGDHITLRDRIAIADFAASSAQPRFHFINLTDGRSSSMRVAHGKGSDPAHTGWLQRFSNENGSEASCEGAFVTADYYVGKHGRSQRLIGLDPTNNNALARAIVVHGAWYANPEMLRTNGMIGRSQGCFTVGEQDLATLFERLGQGRMIYAAKI